MLLYVLQIWILFWICDNARYDAKYNIDSLSYITINKDIIVLSLTYKLVC